MSRKNVDENNGDASEMPKKCLNGDIPQGMPLAGLVSVIHRMYGIYVNSNKPSEELTAGQFPFIMRLSSEPGRTQDELAECFLIDKGTVARAVRKLEDNGIITRRQDPENRRKYHLYLTEKGRRIVPEIMALDRRWEEELLFGFSTEEKEHITGAFRILAEKSHKYARSHEKKEISG